MKALLFTLHAAADLEQRLLADDCTERGTLEHRRFPDGESYIRLHTPVAGRAVVLLCGLDRPDERLAALLLAADAARRQGATRVFLIVPYLAYMRQDCEFQPGEAVSANTFASIISHHFDGLVTLEPHLHRIAKLDDIFTIPAIAAQATEPVGDWIASNIKRPFLIGPDSESAPWIKRIASHCGADFAVMDKVRMGDHEVQITGSLTAMDEQMTPVVIDDIVSSGGTMKAIVNQIAQCSPIPSTCIAVHALWAQTMENAGEGSRLISCNAIPHPSNQINISAPLLAGLRKLLGLPDKTTCS